MIQNMKRYNICDIENKVGGDVNEYSFRMYLKLLPV